MKFCQKCGSRLVDDAVICTHCGCIANGTSFAQATIVNLSEESSTLSTLALVFAFLIPIVGLIMGIIGVATYKSNAYRSKSISAIITSIVMWAVYFMVYYVIIVLTIS